MLESEIESWLNKKVKALGGLSYKFTSPGNPGVPDRIYIFPGGRVWFVELKQLSGRMSGLQKWQRRRIWAHDCHCTTIYGIEDARRFIAERKDELQTT